jgi:hypothetical protein
MSIDIKKPAEIGGMLLEDYGKPVPLKGETPDSKEKIYNVFSNNVLKENGDIQNELAENSRKVLITSYPKTTAQATPTKEEMAACPRVTAYMIGNINYAINAEWSEGSMISNFTSAISNAMSSGGGSLSAAGTATRKYFKGKSDLGLTLNFRLMGQSQLLQVEGEKSMLGKEIAKLHHMVLPSIAVVAGIADIPGASKAIEAAKGTVGAIADTITEAAQPGTGGTAANSGVRVEGGTIGTSTAGSKIGATGEFLGGVAQNMLDNLANTNVVATNAPSPVHIMVGNWLELKEAVVTSLNVTYSTAVNEHGPLYADVQMSVTTRENIAVDNADTTGETYGALLGVGLFDNEPMTIVSGE